MASSKAKHTIERVEGDYAYYTDGSVRWVEGNSQGKQKGGLAKRHPKASMPWAKEGAGLQKAKEAQALGVLATAQARQELSRQALAEALRAHPDSVTEKDGLRMLWLARLEQAGSPDGGGAAVKAHEHIERVWSGTGEKTSVQAIQINIDLPAEVLASIRQLHQDPAGWVEGRVVEKEAEDTEQAAGTGDHVGGEG